MKKQACGVWTAVMAAGMLWCGAAQGATWADANGNVWTYTLSGGKATVTAGPTSGAVSVPGTVAGYPVAAIGACAFQNATGITSLAVANGIGSVGESAFRGCSGLVAANLGTGVTNVAKWAFRECTALRTVTFGPNMAAWGDGLFIGCTSLESMVLPDALDRVPDALFSGCTALTNVTIGTHATRIGNSSFANCALKEVTVPGNVVEIDTAAFTSCAALERVTLCEGVAYLNYGVFSGCGLLEDVGLPDSLQEIGPSSFSGCTGLRSLEVPDHVTLIGNSAFSGCNGLTNIVLGAAVAAIGNSAFQGCSGLSSLVLPGSVETIGNYAFQNCTGLVSLVLPDGVESVGNYAFSGCSNLKRLQVPGAWVETPEKLSGAGVPNGCVVYYGNPDWAFTVADGKATLTHGPTNGAVAVPSVVGGYPVVGLASMIFARCTELTSVTLPAGVATIGSSAFYGCTGLTSIVLPASVKSIGQAAFQGCTGLTNAVMEGAGGAVLGVDAFRGCSALAAATIGGGVGEIGESAFYGCNVLANVTFGNGVEVIGKDAFSGCTGLKEISIPGSVESIATNAFMRCSGLTNLVIGAGVGEIGPGAFSQCSGLTSVEIPSGVKRLGTTAFYFCSSLTNFVIGPDVESIGDRAFYSCSGLSAMVIPDSVTEVGDGLFQNAGLRQLEVPGAWWGSDKVSRIGIQKNYCTVTYRGVDPLAVATLALPPGEAGKPYGAVLEATGGVGEYAWSLGEGSAALPAGMELTAGGMLRGTPAADGTFALVLVATDSAGIAASRALSFSVAPVPDPAQWNWTVANGTATVTSGPTNGCLSIPSELGGYPVTAIAERAFRTCNGVTAVIIPASVTNIGNSAFYFCTSMESLSLGSGVMAIGEFAFDGCNHLTSVELPDSVLTIGRYAFSQCRLLEEVAIGTGVKSIGDYAFSTCSALAELVIPDNVESVGNSAFSGCSALARLEVPEEWRSPDRLANAGVPAGCTVVYRVWTEQTVTFDPNGGTTPVATATAPRGGVYATFPTPKRVGHLFKGWYTEAVGGTRVKGGTPVREVRTLTLHAHWQAAQQVVTFNPNGGTCATGSRVCDIGGKYPTFPTPRWTGHTFKGWYTEPAGGSRVKGGMTVSAQASRTLYAHWSGTQAVTFDPNGGRCSVSLAIYETGKTYPTFPSPKRDGHKFKGWYSLREGGQRVKGGMDVSVDAARTLYAHWSANATPAASPSISGFEMSPCAPAPTVRSDRTSTIACTLWCETVADAVCEIQWSPSLGGEWSVLKRWTAGEDGGTGVTVGVPSGSSTGFFRLVLPDGE
jgi:uncharacterized repeat protein (TIGR02543 family)